MDPQCVTGTFKLAILAQGRDHALIVSTNDAKGRGELQLK